VLNTVVPVASTSRKYTTSHPYLKVVGGGTSTYVVVPTKLQRTTRVVRKLVPVRTTYVVVPTKLQRTPRVVRRPQLRTTRVVRCTCTAVQLY